MSKLDFSDGRAGVTQPGRRRLPATPAPRRLATPPPRRVPAPPRRRILAAVGAVAAAVALVAGFVILRDGPVETDGRPVVLPEKLSGLERAEDDFAESAARSALAKEFGRHRFNGRSYSGGEKGPLVNLVVVRTDARGKGDLRAAHAPYAKFGHVSCTHTFQFSPSADPVRRDETLLCFRASKDLTVSTLVQLAPPKFEKTAAAAINEVWALQR